MVKNQHYVPRFYLKNFLNKEEKCWAFHKDKGKIFLTNLQSIANENAFYDLPQFDESMGQIQPVEKYLSEIENLYSPFLNQILFAIDRREITEINSETRSVLSDLVMFQIIRTKEHRVNMTHGFTTIQDALANKGWLSAELIEAMHNVNVDEKVKQKHLEQIYIDKEFKTRLSEILDSHIWLIFKNMTKTLYYTSDHPVVKIGHLVSQSRSNNGYKSTGIEIAMPLSSTHLLVMFERSKFKEYEEYENQILAHQDPQNVVYYNSMQVSQSYRGIYCAENQFELANEMIKTDPELRKLEHRRFGSE